MPCAPWPYLFGLKADRFQRSIRNVSFRGPLGQTANSTASVVSPVRRVKSREGWYENHVARIADASGQFLCKGVMSDEIRTKPNMSFFLWRHTRATSPLPSSRHNCAIWSECWPFSENVSICTTKQTFIAYAERLPVAANRISFFTLALLEHERYFQLLPKWQNFLLDFFSK